MPNFAQLRTVLGELGMFRIDSGIAKVVNIAIHRHHGDHVDGVADSWFIEVVVELKSEKGRIGRPRATMKAMSTHGKPKAVCADMARDILYSGCISLSQYTVETF